jgi:hypothetical protein
MQPETLDMLRLCGAKTDAEVGVWLTNRQYLAADGSILSYHRMPNDRGLTNEDSTRP